MRRPTVSVALHVAAVLLFVLAAFNVTPFGADYGDLLAAGLAFFALAHVVP